jgi:hypothetical protein
MVYISPHCSERSATRSIPLEAVERALEVPFMEGDANGNRNWGLVRAICDGVWRFVVVVWELNGNLKVAVTAFYPEKGKLLAHQFKRIR